MNWQKEFFDNTWLIWAVFVMCLVVFFCGIANASEVINVERLADSIYIAEGGSKTNHTYGILAHYKTTTPRQACINTIKHALRDWNGRGDFIAFLGSRYCPVGCDNDNGTNKFWIKNVKYYYERRTK